MSWEQSNGKWKYKYGNTYYTSTFAEIDGHIYWFDKNGYITTGPYTKNGHQYFFDPNYKDAFGHDYTGALAQSDWRRALSAAGAIQGSVNDANEYGYFNADGTLFKGGWITLKVANENEYRYYFDTKTGVMKRNWQYMTGEDGQKHVYYFTNENDKFERTGDNNSEYKNNEAYFESWFEWYGGEDHMVVQKSMQGWAWAGWMKPKRQWGNSEGNPFSAEADTWETGNKRWYYFDKKNNRMALGFTKIDGQWYYFAKPKDIVFGAIDLYQGGPVNYYAYQIEDIKPGWSPNNGRLLEKGRKTTGYGYAIGSKTRFPWVTKNAYEWYRITTTDKNGAGKTYWCQFDGNGYIKALGPSISTSTNYTTIENANLNAESNNIFRLNCCNELYNPWSDGYVTDYWTTNNQPNHSQRRQIQYNHTRDYTYWNTAHSANEIQQRLFNDNIPYTLMN